MEFWNVITPLLVLIEEHIGLFILDQLPDSTVAGQWLIS